MSNEIFATNNLSKIYKQSKVIDNINMTIKRGDIYGFIGENGAGKTTMLRLLTGLIEPTRGELYLFGKKGTGNLAKQRKRIGCLVESPMLYPEMTARENLEIERIQRGIPGKKRIREVLELLNLEKTSEKKVKNFSLGMKQRLAIAAALLSNPEFLVLDEPINGLDPSGITQLRELLTKLNQENGLTIIISSHILSELFKLATCFGIIHKGKMLEQLSSNQLSEKCKRYISIKVDDASRAVSILENKMNIHDFMVHPNNNIRIYESLDRSGYINQTLSINDVLVNEIIVAGTNLEAYFNELIGGNIND